MLELLQYHASDTLGLTDWTSGELDTMQDWLNILIITLSDEVVTSELDLENCMAFRSLKRCRAMTGIFIAASCRLQQNYSTTQHYNVD